MQWSKYEKLTRRLKCYEWNEEKCDAPLVLFVLLWFGIIVTKKIKNKKIRKAFKGFSQHVSTSPTWGLVFRCVASV